MRRILALLILGCGACSRVQTTSDTAARKPDLVGSLRTRDHTVEIYAGPLYSLYDADGRPLAELVTTAQLRAERPELSRQLDEMLAQDTPYAGTWAGRD